MQFDKHLCKITTKFKRYYYLTRCNKGSTIYSVKNLLDLYRAL